MKLGKIALLLILLCAPILSWSSEPLAPISDHIVLESVALSGQEKFQITFRNGEKYVLEAVPSRDELRSALGRIESSSHQIDVDPLEPYLSLSKEQQESFQRLRRHFLTNIARVLNSTRFVMGAGFVVGDSLRWFGNKLRAPLQKTDGNSQIFSERLSEKKHRVISSVLKGIDQKLFLQAPLLIESNEFGISAALGLIAETGLRNSGGGGIEEVGISLAYNKSTRAFIVEIYHGSESFLSSHVAMSVVGVMGKASVGFGRRQGAQAIYGESFYPPAVPGFSSTSSDFFAAGVSTSLGLPPPPFSDLFTYTNKFEKNTWIRLQISPFIKGFARLQVGNYGRSLQLLGLRFIDVFSFIKLKMRLYRRHCGPIFL